MELDDIMQYEFSSLPIYSITDQLFRFLIVGTTLDMSLNHRTKLSLGRKAISCHPLPPPVILVLGLLYMTGQPWQHRLVTTHIFLLRRGTITAITKRIISIDGPDGQVLIRFTLG